jgi:thioredoxin 1
MTKTFTDENFEREIQGVTAPVLVDFWAEWCGPCRTLSPVLEELAEELGEAAVVGKVNVDEQQRLAAQYGIRSIPTVTVFVDGEPVEALVGVQPKAAYIAALDRAKAVQ